MNGWTDEVEVSCYRSDRAGRAAGRRALAAEEPLLIEVADGLSFTILRTPGEDRELAAGFLLAEGLIRGRDDILSVSECPEDQRVLRVVLARKAAMAGKRNLAVASSCGLCGRMDVSSLVAELEPLRSDVRIPLHVLYEIPGLVRSRQKLFQLTGGTHAAALFDAEGRVLALNEDLGRHNSLDKVIGHAMLEGIATADLGAFLTGRVTLEMIVKAARASIPVVAAVSAASAAAAVAADRLGLTLCGFVRGEEVTVYTHPERIVET